LQQVYCTNCGLTGVMAGAFHDLPSLTQVILTNNPSITEVPLDFLSDSARLPSLQAVDLAGSGLPCTPTSAYRSMTLTINTGGLTACPNMCEAGFYATVTSHDAATGSCMWACEQGYQADESIPPMQGVCQPAVQGSRDAATARAMTYCSPHCKGAWVGDGVCNHACAVPECGFDYRDCHLPIPDHSLQPMVLDEGAWQQAVLGHAARSKSFFNAFYLMDRADADRDLVLSVSEAEAIGIYHSSYEELGEGTVTGVYRLVTGWIAAMQGVSRFDGNATNAADALIRLADLIDINGMKDGVLSPGEAARLGLMMSRFSVLDADQSGSLELGEVAGSFADPCMHAKFTATPGRGVLSGSFKVEVDALFLSDPGPRTCRFLIQPDWFYPAAADGTMGTTTGHDAPQFGGVDTTVSLYSGPYFPGRPADCLGALVHKKWVLTSGACNAPYARIGIREYMITRFFAHPGAPAPGFDVGLAELSEEAADPPVDFLMGDSVEYHEGCSNGFFSAPLPLGWVPVTDGNGTIVNGTRRNLTDGTMWHETSVGWNDVMDVIGSTPTAYWVEDPVAVADYGQCSRAHELAADEPLPPSSEGRVICAARANCPPGTLSVPMHGTPLFMRTDPERGPILVGIAQSERVGETCGYEPPTIYTKVSSVQQWARSVTRDIGMHAPRGIRVDFDTIDLPPGASVTVTEAHPPEAMMPGAVPGQVLGVDGGPFACQLEGTKAIGKGSVVVEVQIPPVNQSQECVAVGEGCVGAKVEADWEEVGCDAFKDRMCDVEGCMGYVHAEPGRTTCFDPVCQLGLPPWGAEMRKLKEEHKLVMGGLGKLRSDRYPTAKTYACVRDWDAQAEMMCGAREGEYVCFKHLEEDKVMKFMGGVGKEKVVTPATKAAMAAKYRKDKGLLTYLDLQETIRANRAATVANALWWW